MRRIGIFANPKKAEARAFAEELRGWLLRKKKEPLDSQREPLERILKKSDLLVCLGGDGTILHVAGKMAVGRSIPVLGVNVGGLGFLTAVKGREVFDELEAILNGNYHIEERILIRATVDRRSQKDRTFYALNDVVVHRENLTRYLYIGVKTGGEALMNFAGDGVIVATPTGSTAYSLSAGGPFVYPLLDSIVVTPLCAHGFLARSIVLPADRVIAISVSSQRGKAKAVFSIDGQQKIVLSSGDVVEVTKGEFPFRLIASSKRSYLETLREKFGMVQEGQTSLRHIG